MARLGRSYPARPLVLRFSVAAPLAPDLAVTYDAGTPLADGGTYDFGTITQSTTVTKDFDLNNVGTSTLALGNVTPAGSAAIAGTDPSSSTIAAGSSRTLTVRMLTASVGLVTGSMTIDSDDADTPYVLNFTGNVIAAPVGGSGSGNLSFGASATAVALKPTAGSSAITFSATGTNSPVRSGAGTTSFAFVCDGHAAAEVAGHGTPNMTFSASGVSDAAVPADDAGPPRTYDAEAVVLYSA